MAWLPGYAYRKPLVLTGGASGAQTDFQLNIDIAHVAAKMQADFDDIRFTRNDGTTLIDAWLESKVDSASAKTWAEFPTTPANTITQTYYMYYGKVVANYWDGAATFLQYHGAATSEYLDSLVITPSNIAYETKAKYLSNRPFFGLSNNASVNTDDSIFIYCIDTYLYMQSRNEGVYTYIEEAFTHDHDYHKWLITISGGTAYGYYDDNEISSGGISTNLPNETLGLVLDFYSTNNGEQEWSFVRKYAANPPTYAFGSEESAPTGAAPTSIFIGPFGGPLGGPIQ